MNTFQLNRLNDKYADVRVCFWLETAATAADLEQIRHVLAVIVRDRIGRVDAVTAKEISAAAEKGRWDEPCPVDLTLRHGRNKVECAMVSDLIGRLGDKAAELTVEYV